jgi:Spy/CpxP family protein refolding chaperone
LKRTIACSLAVGAVLTVGVLASQIFADDSGSVSPYLDQIQKELKQKDATTGQQTPPDESYTEAEKKKLKADPGAGQQQPYIDSLKQSNPSLQQQQQSGSYTEQQKAIIGPGQTDQSAIDAVNNKKSTLAMKRDDKVSAAFGFVMGVGLSRNVTVQSATPVSFGEIYGGHFVPDFTLYGEHQFFHNKFGSLALVGALGASYYWGYGQFAIPLAAPDNTPFASTSQTKFSFGVIPVSAGADYRFALGQFFHPFVMLKPTAIPYFESRSDGVKGHEGFSKGIFTNFGINFQLDNINKDISWDLYTTYSIKHVYLTVEYTKLTCFSSDVNFGFSGVDLGFMFEY